jgi:hypothetical protein
MSQLFEDDGRCNALIIWLCSEPQFYPECAHLEVANDEEEGSIPSKYMVKIPGVWSMDRTYANGRAKRIRLTIGRTRDQYRHLQS